VFNFPCEVSCFQEQMTQWDDLFGTKHMRARGVAGPGVQVAFDSRDRSCGQDPTDLTTLSLAKEFGLMTHTPVLASKILGLGSLTNLSQWFGEDVLWTGTFHLTRRFATRLV